MQVFFLLILRYHEACSCTGSACAFSPIHGSMYPFYEFFLQIFNTVPEVPLTNAQLHLSRKKSGDSKPPSCSERPLTLFHAMQSTEKRESHCSGQPGPQGTSVQPSSHSGGTCPPSLWVATFCVLKDGVALCPPRYHGCVTLIGQEAVLLRMKGRGHSLSRIPSPHLLRADS